MKDIIEEMREYLKIMDRLIPTGYVPDLAEVAGWIDVLESMQPAAGPWPEDDHDYDAEERLSVLTDTFYTAYQDYDGDHVRLAPMRDDTQSAIEAAIEAVCAVLGRTTRSVGFCAAGPWRTDVENAPKDGRWLLIFSKHDGAMHVVRWSPMDDCFVSDHDGHHFAHSIYAFAELNPYQPEDAAHE